MFLITVLSLLLQFLASALTSNQDIITRDVCILGGGATGTYAAVQLMERGQSVIVVEKKDRLGGHAETFYTPTAEAINYGVIAYYNDRIVRDFFSLLGVEHEMYTPGGYRTDYIDFKTGERIDAGIDLLGLVAALNRYRVALERFPYLDTGSYYLPDEIPEALLRPFREFVEEYDLQPALPIFYLYSYALGDLLESPLLYVIQLFGTAHINAWLHGPFIRPRNGMGTLFREAERYIGLRHILYQSTAVNATRSSAGVELVVESDSGRRTIRAKKLLITFPPLLSNLQGFDLDSTELALFDKWTYPSLHVAVINHSGVPDGFNVINIDPSHLLGLPVSPFQWTLFSPGVSGYYTTAIVGDANMTDGQASQMILDNFWRMNGTGSFTIQKPEIAASDSHTPAAMMVPADDIRNGFYGRLYGLQGQHSTYYTGYTFCTDHSPQLWNFTSSVVDMIIGDSV